MNNNTENLTTNRVEMPGNETVSENGHEISQDNVNDSSSSLHLHNDHKEEEGREIRRHLSLTHQKTLRQLSFLRQRIANSTRESLDSALKAQTDLIQLEDLYLDSLSSSSEDANDDDDGSDNENDAIGQGPPPQLTPSTRALGIFRGLAKSVSTLWSERMPAWSSQRSNLKTRKCQSRNFRRLSEAQLFSGQVSSPLSVNLAMTPFRNLLTSTSSPSILHQSQVNDSTSPLVYVPLLTPVQTTPPPFDLTSIVTCFEKSCQNQEKASTSSLNLKESNSHSLLSLGNNFSRRNCGGDSVVYAPEIETIRLRFSFKPVRLTIERRGKIYAEIYNIPFGTIGLNGFVMSSRQIVTSNRSGNKVNGIGLGIDLNNLDTNSFHSNLTTQLISLFASKSGKSLSVGIQLETPNDLALDDLEVHPPDADNVVWINVFLQ